MRDRREPDTQHLERKVPGKGRRPNAPADGERRVIADQPQTGTGAAALPWDIAGRIEACSDMPSLAAFFAEMIAPHGFTNSGLVALLPADNGPSPHMFFSNAPEAWTRGYWGRHMASVDSLIAESRRRITPFTWQEMRVDVPMPPEERELHDFCVQWGLVDGFVVPIHGPGGYTAIVSLVSNRVLPPLPYELRAWLRVLSLLTHERCCVLTSMDPGCKLPDPLTRREQDCLHWVSAGKSDWEISRILGVSPTTVKFHVDRARHKLGVRTRAQAVARMVLWGRS